MIDDLDIAIELLRAAVERVGANLVEIERDPHRQMLEAATLRGTTAARRQQARDALADLFDGYARMTALVERVGEVRGSVVIASLRTPELEALLAGPSIEVSSAPVAISERALLDGSRKVARCTPDELLARMACDFEIAKRAVFEVARVWDGLVPQVAAAREALDRAGVAAVELGDAWPELAAVRARLDALGTTLAEDPLSVERTVVDAVEQSVVAIVGEVETAAALRREVLARVAAARRELAALVDTAALGADLERIVDLANTAQWRAAARELEAWQSAVDDARRRAEERASAARAVLAHRDELRGRLDAYNAKAAGLGLIEDAQLGRMFDAAQAALYTAPTDLERAEALVRRYQEAVNAAPGRKASM